MAMAIKADISLSNGVNETGVIIVVNSYQSSVSRNYQLNYVKQENDPVTRQTKQINKFRAVDNKSNRCAFTAIWFKNEEMVNKGRYIGNFSFDDDGALQMPVDIDESKDVREQCYSAIESLEHVTNVTRVDLTEFGVS